MRDVGWACSSAGEHYVDIVGVTGSIPVTPTIQLQRFQALKESAGRFNVVLFRFTEPGTCESLLIFLESPRSVLAPQGFLSPPFRTNVARARMTAPTNVRL